MAKTKLVDLSKPIEVVELNSEDNDNNPEL